MAAIAIIPARGGSKRIPRKNIIEFGGRPMIAWTVAAAVQSGRFQRVVVSTDDDEIARVSRDAGAEVPFLRHGHADDHAPVSAATLVALDQAEAHFGERYDVVAQLMANCPLRTAAHLVAAMDRRAASGAPFVVSAIRFGWMNPWWAHRLDDDGRPQALFPEALRTRSQDLPPLYCPTGAIMLAEVAALRASGNFYGPGHLFHEIPWQAGIDIDDDADLAMARSVWLAERGGA